MRQVLGIGETVWEKHQLPPRRTNFGFLVRDALRHLYDLSYLQTHPLGQLLRREPGVPVSRMDRMLQQRLQEAVEWLRPHTETSVTRKAWRRYRLLSLRYIEGMEVPQVCSQLSISQSEFYREQRLGLDAVVSFLQPVLSEDYEAPPIGTPGAPTPNAPKIPSLLSRLPARTPLVGRVQELAFLKSEFEAVSSGDGGRLILVSGEAGQGKTRLAQELGRRAELLSGMFLEGHYLREGTTPYQPWAEVLRAGLRKLKPEELAHAVGPYGRELTQILPELAERLDGFPSSPVLPQEEQRMRIYDGITSVIAYISEQAPLVLFIDDLQWAPSLGLLAHLARNLRDSRVLILGVYREQEFKEQPVLVRTWAELNRARLVKHVPLEPLTEEETAQVVAHHFGAAPAAQLSGAVFGKTRGNPFFVEEVCRTLVESGAIRLSDAGWEVAEGIEVSIPESVKLAVKDRVLRLGEPVLEVLSQAAVLGQEFSFPILGAMTGLPEEELVATIERAIASRLLLDRSGSGEERYAFADDQVQEVLFKDISTPRRRRWHLRAGLALEALHQDRVSISLEELARHFTEGNDAEKGAEYAYRAGEKSDRLCSWARAISWYQTALELWEELGDHLEQRAAVFEKLGDAIYKSTIDAPKAIDYFRQALALYERLDDRRKMAAVHSQMGREYFSSGNPGITDEKAALEHLHVARTLLKDLPESMTLGLAYCGLARVYLPLLQPRQSISWATQAMELGERLHNPGVIANACASLGSAFALVGDVAKGLEFLEQGWQIASENQLAFLADMNRSLGIRLAGPWLKDPRAGLAWAAKQPDYQTKMSLLDLPLYLATVYTLLGEADQTRRALDQFSARLEKLGQSKLARFSVDLGFILLRCGDWDAAKRELEEGLRQANRSHNSSAAAAATAQLGVLYLESGKHVTAEGQLLYALDLYRKGGDLLHQISLLPCLCELCLATGNVAKAQDYLSEAQSIVRQHQGWGALEGDVLLVEGMVRAAQGREREAESAFGQAVSVDQRYSLPWDEAKVYYAWALATIEHSVPGARRASVQRGREFMERAQALWESVGALPYAARCRDRLAEL